MDDRDELERALDHIIDQFAGDCVEYLVVEQMLQYRAQDMRELAYEVGEQEAITADDINLDGGQG